jgi:hypothetical protein
VALVLAIATATIRSRIKPRGKSSHHAMGIGMVNYRPETNARHVVKSNDYDTHGSETFHKRPTARLVLELSLSLETLKKLELEDRFTKFRRGHCCQPGKRKPL